ncbi:DeoR/GlpR family DNA-binding transcription regulator [uncultured Enterococcus sp.]|uniref:DeoR/GlpR family DNA-binding transcription regulator n=1 Tax=uncultured Enterococcus sp. TaxID=167972 RepID=UPI002AA7BCA1|nr:DeoR/GlpR family DNA-binding transcription regulator [uncultured Enterococcus sp.]
MLIEERLERIKAVLEEHKSATIEKLVEELNVSKDTVRRDLIKLEEQNVVKRTHGGAILNNREAMIFNYDQRSEKFHLIKEKIAQKAAELVNDNSSVIFDSSTTVEAVIPQLQDKNIYAITNSLTHAKLLAGNEKSEITLLPGKLHKEQLFLYGSETIQKIAQYNADYALLGIFAISSNGLFIHTEEEGLVKRQIALQAAKVIGVADHTKIDTTGFFKVCELSDIDYLITDIEPEEEFVQALEKNGVDLILARH